MEKRLNIGLHLKLPDIPVGPLLTLQRLRHVLDKMTDDKIILDYCIVIRDNMPVIVYFDEEEEDE